MHTWHCEVVCHMADATVPSRKGYGVESTLTELVRVWRKIRREFAAVRVSVCASVRAAEQPGCQSPANLAALRTQHAIQAANSAAQLSKLTLFNTQFDQQSSLYIRHSIPADRHLYT